MDQSSASFERFRSCLNSDDAGDDDDDKVDDDDDDDNRNLASSPFLTKPRAISSLYSTCTPIWLHIIVATMMNIVMFTIMIMHIMTFEMTIMNKMMMILTSPFPHW